MSLRLLLLVASTALVASAAGAQGPVLVLRVGDPVPGAGKVTDIEFVDVASSGWTTVRVATDDPVASEVLLRGGAPHVKVGDAPPALGGAMVAGIGDPSPDLFGQTAVVLDLGGGSQAVVHELWPQFLTGQPATTWTGQLPPGSTWRRFDDVQFALWSPSYLMRGAIDDPAGAGADVGLAAMVWQQHPGVLSHVDVLALEGQLAPGLTRAIESVRGERAAAAANQDGQRVLWSCDLVGPTTDDGCVYMTQGYPLTQHTLLAREGSPSPVPGRAWGALEDHALDLHMGSWTLRAALDASDPGDDEVLVVDGAVLAREGDVLPALSPFAIESLGAGRGALDQNGRVLWYARWSDPSTPFEDEALLVDDQVLVRTGTTVVGGSPLVDLEDGPSSYALDRGAGRWAIFVGTLADGTRGVFRYDQGGMQTYCSAKTSSNGFAPHLKWLGQPPSASAGSNFRIQCSLLLQQVPTVVFYGLDGPASAPFHGGTLCVAPPLRRLPAQDSGGGPPAGSGYQGLVEVDFNAWIASGADAELVPGQRVHAQVWFRDPGFAPPDDVGLSGGLAFQIGP